MKPSCDEQLLSLAFIPVKLRLMFTQITMWERKKIFPSMAESPPPEIKHGLAREKQSFQIDFFDLLFKIPLPNFI